MISENYQKYVVEFSITVVDPTYSELLRDPEDPQYSDVTQKLTDKVRLKSFYSPELFFFSNHLDQGLVKHPTEVFCS